MNGKMILSGAMALLLAPAMVLGQAKKGVELHGHANNPLGTPYVDTNVFVTPDGNPLSQVAKFVTDKNGDFTGTLTIKPGQYVFVLQEQSPKDPKKEIDDSGPVSVSDSGDLTINFDGTRAEYIEKMSPEMRKQVADLKEKNASIIADQSKVKNLNAMLVEERADRKAGNIDQATQLATQITQGKPDESIGWFELGADQIAAKKYSDAVPNLQKAVELAKAGKKPSPEVQGAALADLGEAYAHTKQMEQAAQSYDAAAKIDPGGAYTYYTNEAILHMQLSNADEGASAASKAIAADPTKPLAYYLKGQSLLLKAGTDASGKVTVPPGCAEAYQKYLELDPNGKYAQEVEGILQGIGAKVPNGYKAKNH
jgi:Flp pilus assembly protein TadD